MRFVFYYRVCLVVSALCLPTLVFAGQPTEWQMTFQPAASEQMHLVNTFHDQLLWLIFAISAFVLALMAFACIRFRATPKRQEGSRTTHNTFLEVLWTVIPVVILVAMAIPSFRLLYKVETIPETDMTIKAIGEQWYWTYTYPGYRNLTFDASMVDESDLEEGQPRLLTTDYAVTVPVGKTVRLQVTSNPDGVIHSWAMPAFGVKVDAVPGRLSETWFRIEREGTYYGQCSELCGLNHAFMPIMVQAVSENEFQQWLEMMQEEWGEESHNNTMPTPRYADSTQSLKTR